MFENLNSKICWRLAWRQVRFHKARSLLTVLAAILTATLFSFVLFLNTTCEYNYQITWQHAYGSLSDIVYTQLKPREAQRLAEQENIKEAVSCRTLGAVQEVMIEDGQLALAGEAYARSIGSFPDVGRMPKSGAEIAVDATTLRRLQLPRELGTKVTLTWCPAGETEPLTQNFTLVGIWEPEMTAYGTLFWVSEDFGERYAPLAKELPNTSLGVTLWRRGDLEQNAQLIMRSAGVIAEYTTNTAFDEYQLAFTRSHLLPFRLNLLPVLLCGFLMFYYISQVSMTADIRFYGRLKTLGMEPSQIRRVVLGWTAILSLFGIPAGWLLGALLTHLVGPMMDVVSVVVCPPGDMALSALLLWATLLSACLGPARTAGRMEPAQAVSFVPAASRQRGRRRRVTLFRLACGNLLQNKARTVLSISALALSVTVFCANYVHFIGYDEERVLQRWSSFDYTILTNSLTSSQDRYLPEDDSIPPSLLEELSGLNGVNQISPVYSAETTFEMSDEFYQELTAYFRSDDSQYMKNMANYVGGEDWLAGYVKMEQSRQCPAVVYGVEDLVYQKLMGEDYLLAGSYDQTAFQEGNCAVVGIEAVYAETGIHYDQPYPAIGSTVTLAGHDFSVTAAAAPQEMIIGRASAQASFCLTFFISDDLFLELFPQTNLRQISFDIDYDKQESVEQFLSDYQKQHDFDNWIISRGNYQSLFRGNRVTMVVPPLVLCVILYIIGILGFVNLLVTKILFRYREYAVYESLGMTRGQILWMLIIEGLLYTGLTLGILYPCGVIGAGPVMQYYYSTGAEWAYQYHFTLLPLHLLALFLTALAVLLPFLCLRSMERQSIMERLESME